MSTNKFYTTPQGFERLSNFPLDTSMVFANYTKALLYATNDPRAYIGQVIAVANVDDISTFLTNASSQSISDTTDVYCINANRTLKKISYDKIYYDFPPNNMIYDSTLQSYTFTFPQEFDFIPRVKILDSNNNDIIINSNYDGKNLKLQSNNELIGRVYLQY